MKRFLKELAVALFIITSIISTILGLRRLVLPPIEIGQVWIYRSANPFVPRSETNIVVAVKAGWVQYVTEPITNGRADLYSVPDGDFRYHAVRVRP